MIFNNVINTIKKRYKKLKINSNNTANVSIKEGKKPNEEELNLSGYPFNKERGYLIILFFVLLLLSCIYPILSKSLYRGSSDLHATIEMVGAFFGLITGFAMIMRFYTLGNRLHLFIGLEDWKVERDKNDRIFKRNADD